MGTDLRRRPAYDSRFYDAIRPGCQASAAAVAPVVHQAFHPARVVDVGGGEGWWAQAFADLGSEALVIDGDYVTGGAPVPRLACDLAEPMPDQVLADGAAPLAVCLEVAEHLPPARAEGFVAELCALAPVVLFSAAQPHQGGTGHVNCQPPAYWAGLFARHGYEASGALRWQVWDHPDVEPWYKSNLLLFADPAAIDGLPAADLFSSPLATPWHVTHPDLWLTRR